MAKRGVGFLLKGEDPALAGTFLTVAKLRTNSLTINGETVDITNKDSPGAAGENRMRELLAGAGVTSFAATGAGVFSNDATQTEFETHAIAGTLVNVQVVFEGGRIYEFAAAVPSIEYAGEVNGEQTYSISIESSGDVTITPGA